MQFSFIENDELPTTIVFHEILKNTRKFLWDILPWVWYAQHNTNKIYNSKVTSKHENMWNKHHPTKINKTHIKNTKKKKNYSNHIRTSYFSKLNNNPKSKKIRARNVKYFEKIRKPIPCSWRLMKRWWRKWRIFVRTWWACEGEEQTRQWTVTMSERKLKSF